MSSSIIDQFNRFHHYTATIENLKVHFIHEHSGEPGAIPLILIHGWPGSFTELVPLIDPLTTAAKTSKGAPVSFDVVIPSLPGYMFSSAPPANWTLDDTARMYNTLMTEVLGYKTYAAHGTDWGSNVAYSMYDNFSTTVRAAHLLGIPFFPLSPDQFPAHNITLDENEQFQEDQVLKFQATGAGYSIEQSTKVTTTQDLWLSLLIIPERSLIKELNSPTRSDLPSTTTRWANWHGSVRNTSSVRLPDLNFPCCV